MPSSLSTAAEMAYIDLWERALNSRKGIRIETKSRAKAISLRQALYVARSQLRGRGEAPYEELSISIDSNVVVIHNGSHLTDQLTITEIDE